MSKRKNRVLTALALSSLVTPAAHATNGMLFEGYGPIATGMGGASFAYDNGLAGMMNNPATLGLMTSKQRLDVAVGRLGPSINSGSSAMNASANSAMGSMYMPAFGWGRKTENGITYGVGVFAQGGVGVEYSADSPFAMGSGDGVRSEVGFMRAMVPVSYQVTPDLIIGGSVDLVRATMDLKMAASIAQVGAMASNCAGAACASLGTAPATNWARFDFSDSSSFGGAASSWGYAGKIGAIYKALPTLTVGAVYQTKTYNGDMKTAAGGANMSMQGGGAAESGTVTINDFNLPTIFGGGLSWTPTNELLVVADVKRVLWSGTLTNFKMNYQGVGITNVDITMPQNWADQTVVNFGGAYRIAEPFVVRAGLSLSSNPVPDANLNPLFPATTKNHYTIGAGYMMAGGHSIDGAISYAPEVTSVNSADSTNVVTVTHSQANAQVMYSYAF